MLKRDKTQLLRHIFIDRKIREGMRSGLLANSTLMAGEYEVSIKSIHRDIDFLKHQCDAPIKYDPRKKGYYYSEENYRMPAVNVNASDLFAICIAEKVLKQHQDTPIYQKLSAVFNRIEDSLPEQVSIHPSWVDSRISIIPHSKTYIVPEIWKTTADALQQSQTLNITYQKPNSSSTQRKIDPYHMANFQGEWYIIAFCHFREKILTLSISRILAAELTDNYFLIPDTFDFNSTTSRFGIFTGDSLYIIKVLFSKELAPYIHEREWHPSQKTTTNKDGSLVFELSSSHLFEIKQWIMSWGGGAEVLEPEILRREIKEELAKTLNQYISS